MDVVVFCECGAEFWWWYFMRSPCICGLSCDILVHSLINNVSFILFQVSPNFYLRQVLGKSM